MSGEFSQVGSGSERGERWVWQKQHVTPACPLWRRRVDSSLGSLGYCLARPIIVLIGSSE